MTEVTLGPINETNMTRIWNKHKQSNTPLKRKVFVGMSGGVDSSVTALLLKQRGFDVIGVFIKNWSGVISPDGQECSWRQDREDALRVAAHLEIPLLTWDFTESYRKRVFQYFLREYKAGRTPNPDVLCNQFLKFDTFLHTALSEGADWIATGHYARIKQKSDGPHLYRGADETKDQSYFLCRVARKNFERVLFPLGDMRKTEVRAVAQKHGIPTKDKKDSQGICFVGDVSVQEFLSLYLQPTPGPIVDQHGKKIGQHHGLAFYTIGQRHGTVGGSERPMYVAEKKKRTNTLVVVEGNDHPALLSHEVIASDPMWMSTAPPTSPFSCQVQIRYRQEPQKAVVHVSKNRVRIITKALQRAVTPGQFVAFYKKNELLGSAVIM